MSLFDLNLQQIHAKLQGKELKVADLVDQSYTRIQQVESKVRAFLTLDEENARQAAAKLDEQFRAAVSVAIYSAFRLGSKITWSPKV